MKKKGEVVALIFVSLILGLILSIQFKTVNLSVGEGVLPTQRAQQLANDLRKVQAEKEAQLRLIKELEDKIVVYEKGGVENDIYAENLYKDAMKYRMLAGYTDIKGPGIILEINDPPIDIQFGEGFSIVDELDLILQLISVLNAADAEAISINDQRYTAFTEIVRAGNHIEINGVSTNSPIVIKAIGNANTLESALSLKWGIVWQLRNYNYIVHLTQDQEVEIPRYRRVKDFVYASPLEETGN